jgi:hypothetical protein
MEHAARRATCSRCGDACRVNDCQFLQKPYAMDDVVISVRNVLGA